MKFLQIKFVRIITLLLLVLLLVSQTKIAQSILLPNTAYAIGDVSVDWNGVPEGSPIFTMSNFAPGQSQSHSVIVTNGAVNNRPIAVRGIKTSETGVLGDMLFITISKGGIDLYGGTTGQKTLNQFFTASALPNFIPLTNLAPGSSATYVFKVVFDQATGNAFQNKTVVFDLKIGLGYAVPAACQAIVFSGVPIVGTSKSDKINGTSGNDLIFGLEGSDKVDGKGGEDCIVGGAGSDAITGGPGNDILIGNEGSDSLDGGDNDDKLYGGDGSDALKGGNGNDELFGEAGSDSMKGENGDDTLIGGTQSDSANGGANTDTCDAEAETSCEL